MMQPKSKENIILQLKEYFLLTNENKDHHHFHIQVLFVLLIVAFEIFLLFIHLFFNSGNFFTVFLVIIIFLFLFVGWVWLVQKLAKRQYIILSWLIGPLLPIIIFTMFNSIFFNNDYNDGLHIFSHNNLKLNNNNAHTKHE